jgi:transposase-like protein|tara:strand:- start:70 stop:1311 length:1242 start_codon:yes stop_codon:yes gene_type:complete
MAHPKKEGIGLLGILQESSGNGSDPLRALLRHTIQQVLEEELTSFLNAEPYTRTEERRGYRNGYKPRTLKTRVGRLELMVPKDREGRFQTELFEKYQRNEKALVLAIIEMYVQGVSTRKVKKITEELCGLEISKSQVSSLAKGLDEEVQKWRTSPLTKQYPYLVVDARGERIRRDGSVIPQSVLIVVGIDTEGYREVLGVWCADSESESSWSTVFRELKERGLHGVSYVVSDDHKGLTKAIARQFQGAIWQRCQVHFIRNMRAMVAKKDRGRITASLKEITGAESLDSARKRLNEAVDVWTATHPKVAEHLDMFGEEMLAVYALPETHRKRMRTTNMLERFNEEIKRRTRVVRLFPNEQACIRLVSALAMEENENWMERKYLNMEAEQNLQSLTGGIHLMSRSLPITEALLSQ